LKPTRKEAGRWRPKVRPIQYRKSEDYNIVSNKRKKRVPGKSRRGGIRKETVVLVTIERRLFPHLGEKSYETSGKNLGESDSLSRGKKKVFREHD